MMGQGLVGGLVVSAYSRPKAFRLLVKSIFACDGVEHLHKIFLIQDGNPSLIQIIEEFRDLNTTIIPSPAPSEVPLININLNRWHSQLIAFEVFKCDWVIALEEDAEIDSDTFSFVSKAFTARFHDRNFRCVNLGSYELGGVLGEFSIVNQGLNGQASAISRMTWDFIFSNVSRKELTLYAYDWLVEPIIRSGYAIVPNSSYVKDNGWENTTHAPTNPNSNHYMALSASFESKIRSTYSILNNVNINHSWPNTYILENFRKPKIKSQILNIWKFSYLRLYLHRMLAKKRNG